MRENFTRYTNMEHPGEVSSAILGRVMQTLQELSIQKTNALQRDKSDIEGIFQAILEEVQAIQNWWAEHHLPLIDALQTLQAHTPTNYRGQNTQAIIQAALKDMDNKIKMLPGSFQAKAYELKFSSLKDTLATLKNC